MIRRPPRSTLFPSPPLFRSARQFVLEDDGRGLRVLDDEPDFRADEAKVDWNGDEARLGGRHIDLDPLNAVVGEDGDPDRKSTRLNSSHANISYAVFCLKKKT